MFRFSLPVGHDRDPIRKAIPASKCQCRTQASLLQVQIVVQRRDAVQVPQASWLAIRDKGEADRCVGLARLLRRKVEPSGELVPEICRRAWHLGRQTGDSVRQDSGPIAMCLRESVRVQHPPRVAVHGEPTFRPHPFFGWQRIAQIGREPRLPGGHGQGESLPHKVGRQVPCLFPGIKQRVAGDRQRPASQPQRLHSRKHLFPPSFRQQRLQVAATMQGGVVRHIEPQVLLPATCFGQPFEPGVTQAPG
jgi:hypothetical protein